jgi:hypothetical protein
MDLSSGKQISRPRATIVPVTALVINAVEAMAAEQGIKSLKLESKHYIGQDPADPADLEGVDSDDDSDVDDDEEAEDDVEDENLYDPVDDDELQDILDDPEQDPVIPMVQEQRGARNDAPSVSTVDVDEEPPPLAVREDTEDSDNDEDDVPVRRSSRTVSRPEKLTYAQILRDHPLADNAQLVNNINQLIKLTSTLIQDPPPSAGKAKECEPKECTREVKFKGVPLEKTEQCHNIMWNTTHRDDLNPAEKSRTSNTLLRPPR